MQKSPELVTNNSERTQETGKLGEIALKSSQTSGETIKNATCGINIVHDHFPEGISPKEHFESEPETNPFETEEDYKRVFNTFTQEELIPTYDAKEHIYKFEPIIRPYKETAEVYIQKTESMIKKITGEADGQPAADVTIYLDKSARPASWFVNEFWDNFTDKPRPKTEFLAIDRKPWFEKFGVKLGFGEYNKDTDKLATWDDLPIKDVTVDDIKTLKSILDSGFISYDELDSSAKVSTAVRRITGSEIDTVLAENDVQGRIARNEITSQEYDSYIEEGKRRGAEIARALNNERLKNIKPAFEIASQIRGLFVPGGLSEEEIGDPNLIMNRDVDMAGKNILIIDEVERSGTTRAIAEHFVSWAFPEAASVRFQTFYKAKTLDVGADSQQNGQMLMIPFWYSLTHDDGTGRGIRDISRGYYESIYEDGPNDINRAALYGSDFIGVPLAYETEKGQKSLRLREQIAQLRVEYEKGHIL